MQAKQLVLLVCTALATMTSAKLSPEQVAMRDWYKGLNPSKVIYAVNCGSDQELEDDAGITFKAD